MYSLILEFRRENVNPSFINCNSYRYICGLQDHKKSVVKTPFNLD